MANYVMKYCKICKITGENLEYKNMVNYPEFHYGYIVSNEDDTKCPTCGAELIDINLTHDDFITIRDVSRGNIPFLEAMIELHQKDIIEYELKMSQFRSQVEQKSNTSTDNTPKCPTCGSTNLKRISTTAKAVNTAMFGLLGTKRHKQWHCNSCGSEW